MSKNEVLEKIYYNLKYGYGSITGFYEEAKKDECIISLEEIKE